MAKERTRKERRNNIESLAEDYGVDMYVMRPLAETLGPNEEYNGLASALEDWVDMFQEDV